MLKRWTLPIAMCIGVGGYLVLSKMGLPVLVVFYITEIGVTLPPMLIFCMLLLTFCRVDPAHITVRRWHWRAIGFQVGAAVCVFLLGLLLGATRIPMLQGAVVCLICPTATAAAVVAQRLGGEAGDVAVYAMMSSFVAGIFVPLVFPLLEPHADLSFWSQSFLIFGKVAIAVLLPFLSAALLRYYLPRVHRCVLDFHFLAFYLWAVALTIVCAKTTHSVARSGEAWGVLLLIAGVALIACVVQFAVGRRLGGGVSSTQGLGQKNTILAIWISLTFLTPAAALAPGAYVLWQNIINSIQLYKRKI